MRTIYKFPLPLDGIIEMPVGAKVLSLQLQFGGPYIWAEVDADPAFGKELRTFVVFGTGHPFESKDVGEFVGTFQLDGGKFVFHVYEGA